MGEESPSSVTTDQDALYDENFINNLRNEFFSCDFTPTAIPENEHIPILLSIEGNIGAGKSMGVCVDDEKL